MSDQYDRGAGMKYRMLGRTGTWVSEISLGAMSFGGREHPVYGAVGGLDQTEANRIVAAAVDAGVNFVDTADVYAAGESEEILGRALRARRDDVLIATKAFSAMGSGPNDGGSTRLHLARSIDNSLKRLGTDRIDVFQLHNF